MTSGGMHRILHLGEILKKRKSICSRGVNAAFIIHLSRNPGVLPLHPRLLQFGSALSGSVDDDPITIDRERRRQGPIAFRRPSATLVRDRGPHRIMQRLLAAFRNAGCSAIYTCGLRAAFLTGRIPRIADGSAAIRKLVDAIALGSRRGNNIDAREAKGENQHKMHSNSHPRLIR